MLALVALGTFFCSFGSLILGSLGSFSSLVLGLPFFGTLLSPRSSMSMQLLGSRRDFNCKKKKIEFKVISQGDFDWKLLSTFIKYFMASNVKLFCDLVAVYNI